MEKGNKSYMGIKLNVLETGYEVRENEELKYEGREYYNALDVYVDLSQKASVIEWEGNELKVIGEPEFDEFFVEKPRYFARAMDVNSNFYFIVWEMVKPFDNSFDVVSGCSTPYTPVADDYDWKNPTTVSIRGEVTER